MKRFRYLPVQFFFHENKPFSLPCGECYAEGFSVIWTDGRRNHLWLMDAQDKESAERAVRLLEKGQAVMNENTGREFLLDFLRYHPENVDQRPPWGLAG